MMCLIGMRSRRFWYMHHGRVRTAEGAESRTRIARALANAKATVLNYLERLAKRALTQPSGPEPAAATG